MRWFRPSGSSDDALTLHGGHERGDARLEAEAWVWSIIFIPIEPAFPSFHRIAAEVFCRTPPRHTEEKHPGPLPGSAAHGHLHTKQRKILLLPGNKSEMSVGYATLYGDMAGGFAPLKDVPKLLVYQLSEYRNSICPVIPARVIERPPSAELAPDQKDERLPFRPTLC